MVLRKINYFCIRNYHTNQSHPGPGQQRYSHTKIIQDIMIQIHENKIIEAAGKGMDEFLKLFTDTYLQELGGEINAGNMEKLNGYQHTLMALRFISEEVNEGGFVQLIQNGYGGYIFNNPVAKALKQMGAKGLSKILYKAKEIYDLHQEELERETTEEEFMAMYVDFEQFDELEEKFFFIEEEETAIIAHYVDEHLEDFVEIVKQNYVV